MSKVIWQVVELSLRLTFVYSLFCINLLPEMHSDKRSLTRILTLWKIELNTEKEYNFNLEKYLLHNFCFKIYVHLQRYLGNTFANVCNCNVWSIISPMLDQLPPCSISSPMLNQLSHPRSAPPCSISSPMLDQLPHARSALPCPISSPILDQLFHVRSALPCSISSPMLDQLTMPNNLKW